MEFIKRVARNYWAVYYLAYVGGVAAGLWRYWHQLSADDGILWLAAIFGASAGSALLVAILLEVTGRMVLLIPAAIKKLKAEGRKEERQRIVNALRQTGVRENGTTEVRLTAAEVIKIVNGESDERS